MQSRVRKLFICMGKEQKGANPMQSRLRKLLICMGKEPKGVNPMQSSFRVFQKCMGIGSKRQDSHAGPVGSEMKKRLGRRLYPVQACGGGLRRRRRISRQRIGSRGLVPVMAAKSCTYAKSLYHKYSDFRGTWEHRRQTGFLDVPRRMCGSLLPLLVHPEDPLAAGNLRRRLSPLFMPKADRSRPQPRVGFDIYRPCKKAIP